MTIFTVLRELPSGLRAILWGGLLLASVPVRAQTQFLEDFTKIEAGTADTNRNGRLDLMDSGAELNGWFGNSAYTVTTTSEGKALLQTEGKGGPANWNMLGKPHGLDLSKAKAVELSMRVANNREAGPSSFCLWLCDENRNGYGVILNGIYPVLSRIGLQGVKFRGSEVPFGEPKNPTFAYAQGEPLLTEAEKGHLEILPHRGEFITLHLRLEQNKTGGPVALITWYTDSSEVQNYSVESPVLTQIDEGDGNVFRTPEGDSGPLMNLAELIYVGLTATAFIPKADADLAIDEETGVWIKDVKVEIVK